MSVSYQESILGPASEVAKWIEVKGAEWMWIRAIHYPTSVLRQNICEYYKPRWVPSLELWEWQRCESDGSDWKGQNEYVAR